MRPDRFGSQTADFLEHRREILVVERHQLHFGAAAEFDGFREPARGVGHSFQAASATGEVVGDDRVVRKTFGGGDQEIEGRLRAIQFEQAGRLIEPAKMALGGGLPEGLADFKGGFPLLILRGNFPTDFEDAGILQRFETELLELLGSFDVIAVA